MPTGHSSDSPGGFKPVNPDLFDPSQPDLAYQPDFTKLPPDFPISLENLAVFAGVSRGTVQLWVKKGVFGKQGEHLVLETRTGYRGRKNGRYTTRRWVEDFLSRSRFTRTMQNRLDVDLGNKGIFRVPSYNGCSKPASTRLEDSTLNGRSAIHPAEIASAYGTSEELVSKWMTDGKGKHTKTILKSVVIDGVRLTCQDWIDEFFLAAGGGVMKPVRGSVTTQVLKIFLTLPDIVAIYPVTEEELMRWYVKGVRHTDGKIILPLRLIDPTANEYGIEREPLDQFMKLIGKSPLSRKVDETA